MPFSIGGPPAPPPKHTAARTPDSHNVVDLLTANVVHSPTQIPLLLQKASLSAAPAPLPPVVSQPLILCGNYDADAVDGWASCPLGVKCPFVHASLAGATIQPGGPHVNYAWRDESAVLYQRVKRSAQPLHVAPPNGKVASDVIATHLVLVTKALRAKRRPLSHCAHYYFNRTCNLGADCQFVHAVFIDPTARLFQLAPGPVDLGRVDHRDAVKRIAARRVAAAAASASGSSHTSPKQQNRSPNPLAASATASDRRGGCTAVAAAAAADDDDDLCPQNALLPPPVIHVTMHSLSSAAPMYAGYDGGDAGGAPPLVPAELQPLPPPSPHHLRPSVVGVVAGGTSGHLAPPQLAAMTPPTSSARSSPVPPQWWRPSSAATTPAATAVLGPRSRAGSTSSITSCTTNAAATAQPLRHYPHHASARGTVRARSTSFGDRSDTGNAAEPVSLAGSFVDDMAAASTTTPPAPVARSPPGGLSPGLSGSFFDAQAPLTPTAMGAPAQQQQRYRRDPYCPFGIPVMVAA